MTSRQLTLRETLKAPAFAARFDEILRDRAPQFVASVLQVGDSMRDVEPKSIIAAAMTAATLDLPINKSLGHAWIVPYQDNKSGRKLAQFQVGYKGYIQLALRSGRYERINARPVNAEAFVGWDAIGEPLMDWSKLDETKDPVGYVFAWRLTNGFTKICYWPKSKVDAHVSRYSQAFRKKFQGPWLTHYHEMALKTVIRNELSRWGILSIQMQEAITRDQTVSVDEVSEPLSLDDLSELEISGSEVVTEPTQPESVSGVNASPTSQAESPSPGGETKSVKTPQETLAEGCLSLGISFDDLKAWIEDKGLDVPGLDSMTGFAELPTAHVKLWLRNSKLLHGEIKGRAK